MMQVQSRKEAVSVVPPHQARHMYDMMQQHVACASATGEAVGVAPEMSALATGTNLVTCVCLV